jgi:uncharacterized protein (DUF885 family)
MKRVQAILLAVIIGLSAVLSGCIPMPSDSSAESSKTESSKAESSKEESSKAESSAAESSAAESSAEESSAADPDAYSETDNEEFAAFVNEQFVNALESDYISQHIQLAHPENYGIDPANTEIGYGSYPTDEVFDQMRADNDALEEEFAKFDRASLSKAQQLEYDILKYQIEFDNSADDKKFDYYGSYFESASGIHYQLATLFADWKLHNEQEVKDVITLIGTTQEYVDSLLDYTRKQEEQGLMMIDLDDVISYCEGILDKGMDSTVLSSLNEAIDGVGLDAGAADEYKAQLADAFETSFLPAYQDILDAMKQFKENGKNVELGFAALPDGKEFYSILVKNETGTDMTVEELKAFIEDQSNKTLQSIRRMAISYPDALNAYYDGKDPSTGYTSYREILDDIASKMGKDFPDVGEIDYNIVDINEEIASDSGVAAYFNVPQIDGTDTREMRVNPNNEGVDTLSLYNTVSHEGFPGHMYQFAYAYKYLDSPYLLTCTNFSGYTEGYAVYASYEAFNYLDGIMEGYADIYGAFEAFTYYAMVLSDIGIHYEGWDIKEFGDFLTDYGFQMDEESTEAQYKQLWANPCIFMPYYVGYAMIKDMRDAAEAELGADFDPVAFHEALLKDSAAPFSIIQKNIDEYVASAKK